MSSSDKRLTYTADVLSAEEIALRLSTTRQAVWAPISGSPEGRIRGTFGDGRVDLADGTIYVKQTAGGRTGWVSLATNSDLAPDPDGFVQVDQLFTGVGGPNATTDTAILRSAGGAPVIEGSGISLLENAANGIVLGFTQAGLYMVETMSSFSAGGGGTAEIGISKNTNAAGRTANPDASVAGMQTFFRTTTLAGQFEGYQLSAVVRVTAAEAAAVNPAPFPPGALVRAHATDGAGGIAGLVRGPDWRLRATQMLVF